MHFICLKSKDKEKKDGKRTLIIFVLQNKNDKNYSGNFKKFDFAEAGSFMFQFAFLPHKGHRENILPVAYKYSRIALILLFISKEGRYPTQVNFT